MEMVGQQREEQRENVKQLTDGKNAREGGEKQKSERRKMRKVEDRYKRMVGNLVANGAK